MTDTVLALQLSDEPRVHRRFWPALRRARSTAERVLAGSSMLPPDPFILLVPPGLSWNVTSSGNFLVGHLRGTITSLVSCSR